MMEAFFPWCLKILPRSLKATEVFSLVFEVLPVSQLVYTCLYIFRQKQAFTDFVYSDCKPASLNNIPVEFVAKQVAVVYKYK